MTRAGTWLRVAWAPILVVAGLLVAREVRLARAVAIPPPGIDESTASADVAARAPRYPVETYQRRIGPDRFAVGVTAGDDAGASVGANAATEIDGFRLAGTFMAYGGEREGVRRLAVVEDTAAADQQIVTVGDSVADGRVTDISRDRLVLLRDDGSSVVLVAFQPGARPTPVTPPPADADGGELDRVVPGTLAYEVSPFRRVINRDALLALQERLLENPVELAEVLGAVQPVRGQRGLEGYRIGELRDNTLLSAFGLRPGDRIHKVNSIDLTSANRAEYFYREFMRNELTALVLELEREGVTTNLIYSVR